MLGDGQCRPNHGEACALSLQYSNPFHQHKSNANLLGIKLLTLQHAIYGLLDDAADILCHKSRLYDCFACQQDARTESNSVLCNVPPQRCAPPLQLLQGPQQLQP